MSTQQGEIAEALPKSITKTFTNREWKVLDAAIQLGEHANDTLVDLAVSDNAPIEMVNQLRLTGLVFVEAKNILKKP